ncbi:hypothetical protein GCM10027199_50220 [Amycolatopsis magusensis]
MTATEAPHYGVRVNAVPRTRFRLTGAVDPGPDVPHIAEFAYHSVSGVPRTVTFLPWKPLRDPD